jgi:hypothetical protein
MRRTANDLVIQVEANLVVADAEAVLSRVDALGVWVYVSEWVKCANGFSRGFSGGCWHSLAAVDWARNSVRLWD